MCDCCNVNDIYPPHPLTKSHHPPPTGSFRFAGYGHVIFLFFTFVGNGQGTNSAKTPPIIGVDNVFCLGMRACRKGGTSGRYGGRGLADTAAGRGRSLAAPVWRQAAHRRPGENRFKSLFRRAVARRCYADLFANFLLLPDR